MTPQQNRILHAQLNALGLMAQKESLVFQFSNGRTKKSSEMENAHANELLAWLRTQQPNKKPALSAEAEKCQKMRRTIISLAWQMNWTCNDAKGKTKCDIAHINDWCKKYGVIKKDSLNDYEYHELPTLVSQFKNMFKTYLNSIQKNNQTT